MAEGIARRLIDRGRIEGASGWEVGSAGVWAGAGSPATMEAILALRSMDIDISSHQSRLLTPDLVRSADLIITMTRAHAEAVLELDPQANNRVRRLNPDSDISDPIGQPQAVYNEAALEIARWVETRLRELEREWGGEESGESPE